MTNDYIQQLDSMGIDYEYDGKSIQIFCPSCRAGEDNGYKMATVFLNVRSANTECGNCHKKLAWEDFLAKFQDKLSAQQQPVSPQIVMARVDRPQIPPSPKPDFKIWSVDEILRQDFGKQQWLIDDIVPLAGLVVLSGNPGEFKTWITMHIALSVADGVPVLGKFPSTQGPVLVIDEENHLRLIQQRLQLLHARTVAPISYLSLTGFRADKKECVEAICAIIKERRITLVIIDSLVRIHGQQENDASQMASVFNALKQFTKEGTAVLFTHHHRKQYGLNNSANAAQNMRGSSDILAAVDGHVSVEKKQNEDTLIFRHHKSRQSEQLEPFEVTIVKDENGPRNFVYKGRHDEKKKKAEEAADTVTAFLRDGMKGREEIETALTDNFGKGAVNDGIKQAQARGQIERVPKNDLPKGVSVKSRKYYYRLVEAVDVDSR